LSPSYLCFFLKFIFVTESSKFQEKNTLHRRHRFWLYCFRVWLFFTREILFQILENIFNGFLSWNMFSDSTCAPSVAKTCLLVYSAPSIRSFDQKWEYFFFESLFFFQKKSVILYRNAGWTLFKRCMRFIKTLLFLPDFWGWANNYVKFTIFFSHNFQHTQAPLFFTYPSLLLPIILLFFFWKNALPSRLVIF
jgi:hypothetical protein